MVPARTDPSPGGGGRGVRHRNCVGVLGRLESVSPLGGFAARELRQRIVPVLAHLGGRVATLGRDWDLRGRSRRRRRASSIRPPQLPHRTRCRPIRSESSPGDDPAVARLPRPFCDVRFYPGQGRGEGALASRRLRSEALRRGVRRLGDPGFGVPVPPGCPSPTGARALAAARPSARGRYGPLFLRCSCRGRSARRRRLHLRRRSRSDQHQRGTGGATRRAQFARLSESGISIRRNLWLRGILRTFLGRIILEKLCHRRGVGGRRQRGRRFIRVLEPRSRRGPARRRRRGLGQGGEKVRKPRVELRAQSTEVR
jgi:hypothetical protein